MGTSKILSNHADVGTALSIHSSMFAEQVLLWVPTSVTVTKESSTGYPRFVAFCVATVHSPFCFAHMAPYKQLENHKKLIYVHTIFFSRVFFDYLLVDNMPILIVN